MYVLMPRVNRTFTIDTMFFVCILIIIQFVHHRINIFDFFLSTNMGTRVHSTDRQIVGTS